MHTLLLHYYTHLNWGNMFHFPGLIIFCSSSFLHCRGRRGASPPSHEEGGDIASFALFLIAWPINCGRALALQRIFGGGPREADEVHRVPEDFVLAPRHPASGWTFMSRCKKVNGKRKVRAQHTSHCPHYSSYLWRMWWHTQHTDHTCMWHYTYTYHCTHFSSPGYPDPKFLSKSNPLPVHWSINI